MRHYFCTTEKCTTERTTERPNVRPNVRPNDQKRTTERPKAYDRATAIRRTERTCECADVRPTKNTHRAFFIRKNLLWAVFSNFWLDIQWRNSHSQQQFVLNVGYPISSQKHVSGTSTLWSVSLRPKLALISLIQTTKKKLKKTQPICWTSCQIFVSFCFLEVLVWFRWIWINPD